MVKDLPALLPDFHKQLDFFICGISDISAKGDTASMEHPVFSLAPHRNKRSYERNGKWIEIDPTTAGSATVHDRDILIYCISQCLAALENGREISRTLRFTASELMVATNRNTKGGSAYEGLKNALDRLSGTRIKTNLINGKFEITKGFGLLESFEIITEHSNGRMKEIEVTLPIWICDAIQNKNVLTLHHNYFRLRKPLEKRLYELARKHCGNQSIWKIKLSSLFEKCGSTSSLKQFKQQVGKIVSTDREKNYMPDYSYEFEKPEDTNPLVICLPKTELLNKKKSLKNIPLSPDTIQRAKKYIPAGFDIYATVADWKYFVQTKRIKVENLDAHFIDFAKKWGKNHSQLSLRL